MNILGNFKSWEKFSEEINGKFHEKSSKSNMPHIMFKIDDNEVIYKINKSNNMIFPRFQTNINMELNYKEISNLKLVLEKNTSRVNNNYKETPNVVEIKIADSEFGDIFQMYSNNDRIAKAMMNKSVIRRLLKGIPINHLIIDTIDKEKYISIYIDGVVKNIETLRKMYYLIIEILGIKEEI